MHVNISSNPDQELETVKDGKPHYVIVPTYIVAVVWHGALPIFVRFDKSRYILNVFHEGEVFGAKLPAGLSDVQAARCAPAFFEAIKAGHDSFEVKA